VEGTWEDFKTWVTQSAKLPYIFRGQTNDSWKLISLWHRLAQDKDLQAFSSLLPFIHDYVSPWANRIWNLDNQLELAAFVGFLRHNRFPTPLLDWTLSPYMAAYFAFEGVNDQEPASDHIAVFRFDPINFHAKWEAINDLRSKKAHVSLVQIPAMGNPKHVVQQSAYTFSSVIDQEQHIRALEQQAALTLGLLALPPTYLVKYRIHVREKPAAMRELRLMGISAMTLFPGSMEAVCKSYQEAVFAVEKIGETPSERAKKFVEYLLKTAPVSRKGPDVQAVEKPGDKGEGKAGGEK